MLLHYSVNVNVTEEEFVRFNRFILRNNKKLTTTLVVCWLFFLAVAVGQIIAGTNLPLAIGMFAGILVSVLILTFGADNHAKKYYRQYITKEGTEQTIDFFDDHYVHSTSNATANIAYSQLAAIHFTKTNIYLMRSPNMGAVISLAASPDGLPEFLQSIVQSIVGMEVLAKNITHKDPNHSNVDDISRCIVFFLSAALILYGTWLIWRVLPSEIVWLVLLMFANVLFAVYGGLVYLNKYLRWNRTTETISVQHETLVIECHGCIFHRRKEIPLSAIRRVETYNGRTLWLWGRLPETLRVVYSNSRRYRFGLCMTDAQRDALAKKITDLAKQ